MGYTRATPTIRIPMLSLHAARKRAHKASDAPRIGLAVAGGGPIGGMYELGVLRALDEGLTGLDLTRLDCYVGVSSGAFLAAGLANRVDTAEMCRIFITGDSSDVKFQPELFTKPAFGEYLKRAASLPRLASGWWRDRRLAPDEPRWADLVARLGRLLPAGLFDNTEVERFLRDAFTRRGRSNDFRKLDAPLYVVAVDLNNGEVVRFGDEGWDHVPISKAVQASAALPGLYSPVAVQGRHFVDGALRRTMHASVLLERDIDLLIGINPLVPFDTRNASIEARNLATGGLPAVLSQTFRTLLQSRMQVGLARYAQQYPDVDQLVFEPNAEDAQLFFANAFSFAARRRICEIAYRHTLADLRTHADVLRPLLAAHGVALNEDVVNDAKRSILDGLPPPARDNDTTGRLKRALDDVDQIVAGRKPSGRRRH